MPWDPGCDLSCWLASLGNWGCKNHSFSVPLCHLFTSKPGCTWAHLKHRWAEILQVIGFSKSSDIWISNSTRGGKQQRSGFYWIQINLKRWKLLKISHLAGDWSLHLPGFGAAVILSSSPIQSALLATSMESPWPSARPAWKWGWSRGLIFIPGPGHSSLLGFLLDYSPVGPWICVFLFAVPSVLATNPAVASGPCTPVPVPGPAVVISLYLCPALPQEPFLNSLHCLWQLLANLEDKVLILSTRVFYF